MPFQPRLKLYVPHITTQCSNLFKQTTLYRCLLVIQQFRLICHGLCHRGTPRRTPPPPLPDQDLRRCCRLDLARFTNKPVLIHWGILSNLVLQSTRSSCHRHTPPLLSPRNSEGLLRNRFHPHGCGSIRHGPQLQSRELQEAQLRLAPRYIASRNIVPNTTLRWVPSATWWRYCARRPHAVPREGQCLVLP